MDSLKEKTKKITKLDIVKAWAKWCLAVEVPVSFDRMQALAFSFSISHILKKFIVMIPKNIKMQ